MSRLLELTLCGSVVALTVLAIDRIASRYVNGGVRRVWWLFAALGFLVPFHAAILPLPSPSFALPGILSAPLPKPLLAQLPASVGRSRHSWGSLLLCLWVAGIAVHLAWALFTSIRTQARWAKSRLCTDSPLLELIEDCKADSNLTLPIGVVLSDSIISPAILGWLRPRLLLPSALVKDLPPAELRLILLHELAHIRHRDIATNWLFVAVRSIHWFNPVAVLAGAAFKRFAEEAADEAALRRGGAGSTEQYGHALLATIKRGQAAAPAGGFLFLGESFSNLKQRITMIAYAPSRRPHRTVGLLVAALLCALILVRPAFAAEDPAEAKKAATVEMTTWLTEIDEAQFAKSWTDASSLFQKAVSSDVWQQQLASVRTPLGRCKGRVAASALLQASLPGKPGIEAVIVQFKTSFENLVAAIETVTFVKEGDTWKAAGYYIKPA